MQSSDRGARPGVQYPERMQSASPQVEIPVSAEDVAHRRRRIFIYCSVAALLTIAIGAWIYKRNVDSIYAMESYDDAVHSFRIARYHHAILALDRAVALKPQFADAYLLRGRAYAADSNIEPALRDLTTALQLRPNDTAALLARAGAYLNQKDYHGAIADTTAALHNNPALNQAYNLRGCAVRALGDAGKALEDFHRAVELDANVDNYYQRAATYQLLDQHHLAIADLNQVIKFKPDQAPAYFARSKSRKAIGDLNGAIADYRQGRLIDSR